MYRVLLPFVLLSAAPAAAAGLSAAQLEALRTVDLRLATIGYRLATANAPLCEERMPATGLVLHAINQYDADTSAAAHATFGFATPIAVEAVVPGSPAARAGVVANDGLAAIAGAALTAPAAAPTSADRDAAQNRLTALPAETPVAVTLARDGRQIPVTLPAQPGCRAAFEVVLGPDWTASSDGYTIQVGVRFLETLSDDEVAVLVAHELSHNILRHRARLDAAGVSRGLFKEVGRSGRLWRQTEDEADQLSVHLLYNAGYDPASAARFWRGPGDKRDGGLFRSRTHASSEARAKAVAAEAATLAGEVRPSRPALLAGRGQALR